MEDLIYEPSMGEKVTHAIADMHAAAVANNCTVRAKFNEYELVVTPQDNLAEVLRKYNAEMDAREAAYKKSPEYKQRQLELDQRREAQKNKIKLLCENYPDFNNIEAVVDWFEKASECDIISLRGLGIVETFELEGYRPNVNCYDKFNANDKENFGRWLIGQALSCIEVFGSIHPIFADHAKQWRERFGVC